MRITRVSLLSQRNNYHAMSCRERESEQEGDLVGALRIAARVLSAVSAVLWGMAALSTWAGIDPHALAIEANAAASASVLAGVCLIAYAVRDRDKDALVAAMADFSQRRATAETRPQAVLRRVG